MAQSFITYVLVLDWRTSMAPWKLTKFLINQISSTCPWLRICVASAYGAIVYTLLYSVLSCLGYGDAPRIVDSLNFTDFIYIDRETSGIASNTLCLIIWVDQSSVFITWQLSKHVRSETNTPSPWWLRRVNKPSLALHNLIEAVPVACLPDARSLALESSIPKSRDIFPIWHGHIWGGENNDFIAWQL